MLRRQHLVVEQLVAEQVLGADQLLPCSAHYRHVEGRRVAMQLLAMKLVLQLI